MIEAAMIWNEPNNKSHWDPEIDPDWSKFAEMGILAHDDDRTDEGEPDEEVARHFLRKGQSAVETVAQHDVDKNHCRHASQEANQYTLQ